MMAPTRSQVFEARARAEGYTVGRDHGRDEALSLIDQSNREAFHDGRRAGVRARSLVFALGLALGVVLARFLG